MDITCCAHHLEKDHVQNTCTALHSAAQAGELMMSTGICDGSTTKARRDATGGSSGSSGSSRVCAPCFVLCISCATRTEVADIDRFFIAAKVTPAELKKIPDQNWYGRIWKARDICAQICPA